MSPAEITSWPIGASPVDVDQLTGLGSRTLLTRLLTQPASLTGRRVLLLLGLDRFREVNRSLGHAAGDELLIEISHLLRSLARPSEQLFRIGGDEFALLSSSEGEADAVRRASGLLSAIQMPVQLSAGEVAPTASAGVAVEEAFADVGLLLSQADAALSRAKRLGGHRLEFFTETLRREELRREELNADLHGALNRDEFRMHYQPELDLRTGKFVAVEALLRWQPADARQADAAELIEVAESSDLIVKLGDWTLRQALRDARRLDLAAHSPPTIAVNVSIRQLLRPDFSATVAAALATYPIGAHRICLEVTETGLADNIDRVIATLHELRAMGLRLAIDDFGTGHASLTYLAHFPVDYVKIDRTFVAGLGVNPTSRVIVSSVAEMAHALGIRVIAEGVETTNQLHMLLDAGCDIGQGYLFARPTPVEVAAGCLASTVPWPVPEQGTRSDSASVNDRGMRYRLLLNLAREVTGRIDVEAVLTRTFVSLRQLLTFSGGSIQLIEGDTIGLVAGEPAPTPEALQTRIPLGQGIGGRIAMTGEPRYIPDILDEPDISPEHRRRSISGGVRSYFGAPLIAHGQIIGLLQIDSDVPDAFSDEDRFLLLAFTPIVAASLETARLLADRELVTTIPAQRGLPAEDRSVQDVDDEPSRGAQS